MYMEDKQAVSIPQNTAPCCSPGLGRWSPDWTEGGGSWGGLGFTPLSPIEPAASVGNTPGYEWPIQGTDALSMVAMGLNMVPVVGQFASAALTIFSQAGEAIEEFLNIGEGRDEADVIVPFQNQLMDQLGQVTNAIRTNQRPSLAQLQGYYNTVWAMGQRFKVMVGDQRFADGRASAQALSTVMPYIDGTGGYTWPDLQPTDTESGQLRWGDGTLGGAGFDGMLGAIGRAIQKMGGAIPMPQLMQGQGSNIPTIGYPFPGGSQLPQSGTIYPRTRPQAHQAGIIPVGGGGAEIVLPLLVGAGAFLLLRGRK